MAVVRRRRADRVVTAALLFLLIVVLRVAGAGPARADPAEGRPLTYRPPVDGIITDPFRAPAQRFGPGNRGIDYAVPPLSPVRAAADGVVIFAGPVAGTLHVTIRHPDGLRSSYSFLASVTVTVGQPVRAGDEIGRTTEVFHFGVRDPTDTYLDPALLFGSPGRAHLVPGGDDGTAPVDREPAHLGVTVAARGPVLEELLARALGASGGGVAPPNLVDRTRLWAHLLRESTLGSNERRVQEGLARWVVDRQRCTPASEPAPRPASRRILVQVGGIGSTSETAAVTRVDSRALGYADADVVRFSYAGGRVPSGRGAPSRPLGAIPARPYGSADSQIDLRVAADRLAALLAEVAAAEPGVPIDVVAHSQGGIVARLALDTSSVGRPPAPPVATLVTLGSPHQGADLAGVVQAGRLTDSGRRALASVRATLGLDLDPDAPAAAQLAPTSALLDELARSSAPPGVHLMSVGARGDIVVPAGRTVVAGMPSAVVSVSGPRAHDRLPGAAEATREIALAVAGRPPTCRSLADAATDLVVGGWVIRAEANLGLAVAEAARWGRTGPSALLAGTGGTHVGPLVGWTGGRGNTLVRWPGGCRAASQRHHRRGPPTVTTACRRSCRAPVSPNRGKETSQWHLS
jgi:hypothetical protein